MKAQSYRPGPLRHEGTARMCSRRMPVIPLGLLGAMNVAEAEWKILMCPVKDGQSRRGTSAEE